MPSQNLATYLSECTNENQNLTSLDLSSVTSKVATSLREAEVTIQSSLAALSAEISDDDRDRVLRQLGASVIYFHLILTLLTCLQNSALLIANFNYMEYKSIKIQLSNL